MPAKPAWYNKINDVIRELRSSLVLSSTGPRSNSCSASAAAGPSRSWRPVSRTTWTNGLADRDRLITRLRRLAGGDDGYYEVQRRRQVATVIDRLRKERMERPQLFVEAPACIVNQKFENLPAGLRLEPGRITVEFDNPQQALEKLLALVMAIGNDSDCFERQIVAGPRTVKIAAVG